MSHPDLRPFLAEAELPTTERSSLLEHLRSCPLCRAEVVASDPTRLFTLLAAERVPPEVLERVSTRAAAAIAVERQRRTIRPWAMGAVAASLLVAGLFGAYLSNRPGVEPPAPLPVKSLLSKPKTAAEVSIPAWMIEVLESPGDADVVEMSVGDVQIVMIFDEALEI
jgi:anti-sigma factor RsiW